MSAARRNLIVPVACSSVVFFARFGRCKASRGNTGKTLRDNNREVALAALAVLEGAVSKSKVCL